MDKKKESEGARADTGAFHFGDVEANAVYIFGEIDPEWVCPDVIVPLLEYAHCDDPLEIYVNTPGGIPHPALTVAEIIDRLTIPTTVILLGEVCSAGFLLAVAGANNPHVETVAFPSTRAMWHVPRIISGSGEVPLHEIQDFVSDTIVIEQYMKDYILSHSSISQELLEEQSNRTDWWLGSEDLLKLGIIDRVL